MATTSLPGPARAGAAGGGGPVDRPEVTRPPRRRELGFLVFLSPWIIGFLIFTLWPVLYSGYLSFTDYDGFTAPSFIGLDNYRQMAEDPKIRLSLWNTFFYTFVGVPLHILASLALALLLNQAGRSSGFFRTAFFLPKMTPPVAAGILLLLLFNGQQGLFNQVLGWFGIDGPAWTTDPTWVKPGLIILSLWTIGSSTIILLAALRNVPNELYESATVDGANFLQRTRMITVPMISGTIFFLVVVNTIGHFQIFTEAYTAYFGSGNTTYSNDAALFYVIYLFQQGFEFFNMGYASAMAWLLFVIIMIFTAVQLWLSKRFVYYEGRQG